MLDSNIEKILEQCPDNEDFILYLMINGESNCLKVIEDYEIYGDLLKKLLKTCKDDFSLAITSLDIAIGETNINKQIVHNNLKSNNPIPFAKNKCLSNDKNIRIKQAFMELKRFYCEYEINNQKKSR